MLMLSYLQNSVRADSITRDALTDVARVTFATAAKNGETLGIRMTGVTVTGFDAQGDAVVLLSTIRTPSASTVVRRGADYDINHDGKVDQLDITTCQRYYQAHFGDSDWSAASNCDVNGDNRVDIEDMVAVLQYMYQN